MTTLIHVRANTKRPARNLTLGTVFAIYKERRALARLDQAALADIGLTAEEARIEASRPIWDLPHR